VIRANGVNAPVSKSNSESRIPAIGRFFSAENRYLPPLLITLILVVGQAKFGLLESFSRTALAIATSMILDLVLARLVIGSAFLNMVLYSRRAAEQRAVAPLDNQSGG